MKECLIQHGNSMSLQVCNVMGFSAESGSLRMGYLKKGKMKVKQIRVQKIIAQKKDCQECLILGLIFLSLRSLPEVQAMQSMHLTQNNNNTNSRSILFRKY